MFPLKQFWLWPYHFLKYRLARYDMVVALNGQSRTTGRLAKFADAPVCVGTWYRATEQYYKDTVLYREGEHTIEFQLRVAEAVGAPSDDLSMVFPVSDELKARARTRYPRREGRKRVAMFIGNAKKVDTRWPEDRFAELAKRLIARGDTEIHVIAGPGDEGLLPPFAWSEDCGALPRRHVAGAGRVPGHLRPVRDQLVRPHAPGRSRGRPHGGDPGGLHLRMLAAPWPTSTPSSSPGRRACRWATSPWTRSLTRCRDGSWPGRLMPSPGGASPTA